jgi:uncharacterized membrane protein SpoIIM required for sporulation
MSRFKEERDHKRMTFMGFLYCTLGVFLSIWIFKTYSSMIMVFLTAMAAIPLVYKTIKIEEQKDLGDLAERLLIKEHGKALRVFIYLFIGVTIAAAFWYVVLPSSTISVLYEAQTTTINAINSRTTGLTFDAQFGAFTKIFLNNAKVLVFCILFAFLYGFGAIFILTWNASVVGTAIGNFVRSNLALYAEQVGIAKATKYFHIISLGLFKYSIHGVPEILAYFTAGLAGGIISIAIIRHDLGTRKFEHILLDSVDLILLSLAFLFLAAVLEVWVTPMIF